MFLPVKIATRAVPCIQRQMHCRKCQWWGCKGLTLSCRHAVYKRLPLCRPLEYIVGLGDVFPSYWTEAGFCPGSSCERSAQSCLPRSLSACCWPGLLFLATVAALWHSLVVAAQLMSVISSSTNGRNDLKWFVNSVASDFRSKYVWVR